MEPITAAIVAGLLGTSAGSVLGYIFGKSAAQEEIEALQQTIIQLVSVIEEREARIAELMQLTTELELEIEDIKADRTVVERFLSWVGREEPEVLERYQALSQINGLIEELDTEIAQVTIALDGEIDRVRSAYPDEFAEFQEALLS